MPRISIITPTFERARFHARIAACVQAQTLADLEWLVLDDSATPSPVLTALDDPRLRYTHLPQRMTIGDKRNLLAEQAKGETILHFDDDDWYAPGYAEAMAGVLDRHDLDFCNLRGWYLHDLRQGLFGYWNLEHKQGLLFVSDASGIETHAIDHPPGLADVEWGFGFTYAYRRHVAQAVRFPSQD